MSLSERIKKVEAGAFWQLLGMKVQSASAGEAIVTVEVKPDSLQLRRRTRRRFGNAYRRRYWRGGANDFERGQGDNDG